MLALFQGGKTKTTRWLTGVHKKRVASQWQQIVLTAIRVCFWLLPTKACNLGTKCNGQLYLHRSTLNELCTRVATGIFQVKYLSTATASTDRGTSYNGTRAVDGTLRFCPRRSAFDYKNVPLAINHRAAKLTTPYDGLLQKVGGTTMSTKGTSRAPVGSEHCHNSF